MKKEKMSLEKMKSVLSNVLSRDEMKQVMAGSATAEAAGTTALLNHASPVAQTLVVMDVDGRIALSR